MIVAIVPAAGLSRRMGRPKLILPLADGRTVLGTVLNALRDGGVDRLVIVTPPKENPITLELEREGSASGALIVVPEVQPPDMRDSVEQALSELKRLEIRPATILICPADSPGISSRLVSMVIARAKSHPQAIVIPSFLAKRGHPIALPYSIAETIPDLPKGVGVNTLVKQHAGAVIELVVDESGAVLDLDTPEDYRRWVAR